MSEQTAARNARKVREGLVVSDKMDKTVVVSVEDRVKHALYGKVMRKTLRLKAHDEQNACGIGDRVLVMETRPLSATLSRDSCWIISFSWLSSWFSPLQER